MIEIPLFFRKRRRSRVFRLRADAFHFPQKKPPLFFIPQETRNRDFRR